MSVLAQLVDLRLRPRPPAVTVTRAAEISACGTFCWSIRREMRDTLAEPAPDSVLPWILLHPPVPDVTLPKPARDHAALSRLMGLTWSWGFDAALVVHLFAFRARNSAQLRQWLQAPGFAALLENYTRVAELLAPFDAAIAAWGVPPSNAFSATADAVLTLLEHADLGRAQPLELFSLGSTHGGYPKHPLGLSLQPWPLRLSRETLARSLAA